MPRLQDAIERAKPYTAKFEKGQIQPREVHPVAPIAPTPPLEPIQRLSSILCCPLPGIVAAPDSLVQFYRQGIPQMRILAPKVLSS